MIGAASKAISKTDPRIDDYIAKAAPFARPILVHLRGLLHKGCPGIEETVKWSRPFFQYRGAILCNISAFKEHCTFGFWGSEIGDVLRAEKLVREGGMGSFGRLTSVTDLPSDKKLLNLIRQAAGFIESGNYTSPIAARRRVVKAQQPSLEIPAELTSALQKNPKAEAAFAEFSLSCQREYIEWIADAKRAETRDKRIATAIEWLEQGRQRHWKYQKA